MNKNYIENKLNEIKALLKSAADHSRCAGDTNIALSTDAVLSNVSNLEERLRGIA